METVFQKPFPTTLLQHLLQSHYRLQETSSFLHAGEVAFLKISDCLCFVTYVTSPTSVKLHQTPGYTNCCRMCRNLRNPAAHPTLIMAKKQLSPQVADMNVRSVKYFTVEIHDLPGGSSKSKIDRTGQSCCFFQESNHHGHRKSNKYSQTDIKGTKRRGINNKRYNDSVPLVPLITICTTGCQTHVRHWVWVLLQTQLASTCLEILALQAM